MAEHAVETTSPRPVPEVGLRLRWDDPDKTAKLVAFMTKWRIRLSFMDVCEIFGATVKGEPLVRAYLMRLAADGTLVEPVADLYCLPSMTKSDQAALARLIEDGTVERAFGARKAKPSPPAPTTVVAPPPEPPRSDRAILEDAAGCAGWQLRWLASRGGFMTHGAIVVATIRAGFASQQWAARALKHLLDRGYVADHGFVMVLTRLGERAAEIAGREARGRGDPPIPIPEEMLPRIVWVDTDFETD
jgi:hypothetical protein